MTPGEVGAMRDAALDLSQPLIDDLLADICRRVAKAGKITDIRKPEIVTNTPYAGVLFYGKRGGKPIHYTTTYNKQAGPRPDLRLSAEEGAAMAAELQRYINRKG